MLTARSEVGGRSVRTPACVAKTPTRGPPLANNSHSNASRRLLAAQGADKGDCDTPQTHRNSNNHNTPASKTGVRGLSKPLRSTAHHQPKPEARAGTARERRHTKRNHTHTTHKHTHQPAKHQPHQTDMKQHTHHNKHQTWLMCAVWGAGQRVGNVSTSHTVAMSGQLRD